MNESVKDAIRAKIKKLELLLALTEDPEMVSLLREAMGTGNGSKPAIHLRSPFEVEVAKSGPSRGEQQRKVEEALATATEPVATDWIVAQMQAQGYQFKAAKPRVAVNECLRYAEEHGRARIAKKEGVTNYWIAAKLE